jgi:hypothetical protein
VHAPEEITIARKLQLRQLGPRVGCLEQDGAKGTEAPRRQVGEIELVLLIGFFFDV